MHTALAVRHVSMSVPGAEYLKINKLVFIIKYMKIAVISDIHQSVFWRGIIDKKDDFEKIVFLGDEFDCYENEWPFQMINAENIISFKKSCPEKVDLCWSNHAVSYFLDERCSGFQRGHAAEIKEFYIKNKDLFNVIYIYDNWIFSHGGISAGWMKCSRINKLSEINQFFREKPGLFKWVGPDNYGNNPNEGPLWIRPESLIANHVPDFNQITGHTENNEPKVVKSNNQFLVFSDTYKHDFLTILETRDNSVEFVKIKI